MGNRGFICHSIEKMTIQMFIDFVIRDIISHRKKCIQEDERNGYEEMFFKIKSLPFGRLFS